MNFSKTYQNRRIKIPFSSDGASSLKPRISLEEELFLFSAYPEAFPHISKNDISIINKDTSGQAFFSTFPLSEDDTELFLSLMYRSEKFAALFPLGKKLLFVSSHLLRSGGPGIALVISCSPECSSALARSELSDALGDLIFSPSFGRYSPKDEHIMELYRSISRFTADYTQAKRSVFDLIRASAELSSVSANAELSVEANADTVFDPDAIFSLLLCLFSHASRIGTKKASVTLSGAQSLCVTVEFESSDPDISADLLFCEKSAQSMGISFSLQIYENETKAMFIPRREGPGDGFKSGIFINGKRFINPFLRDIN